MTTDATHIEPSASPPSGPTWPALQLILHRVAAARSACQRKDPRDALHALSALQDTIDPAQGDGAAELFVVYRSLAHLVELGAWDEATPILAALLDACLHALADARGGLPHRIS